MYKLCLRANCLPIFPAFSTNILLHWWRRFEPCPKKYLQCYLLLLFQFFVLVAIIWLKCSIALAGSRNPHLHITCPSFINALLLCILVGGSNSTIAFSETQSVVMQCMCVIVQFVHNIISFIIIYVCLPCLNDQHTVQTSYMWML